MNRRVVAALVAKDIRLFFRNRLFGLVTVLGLVVYVGVYFGMPGSVDEDLEIGMYAPVVPPAFEEMQPDGVKLETVESEEALLLAITDGEYPAGMVLPADIMQKFDAGLKPEIDVYLWADSPAEVGEAVEFLVTELSYAQTGQPLSVQVLQEVLGPDMLDRQIPARDRMVPFFAVLILVAETFGMASLISEEVQRGTVTALLVTPVSVPGLFVGKGITGVCLAFVQVALYAVIIGGMESQPAIVLLTLLLGAVLVTGVGFFVAALGKDLMSVMAWGVVAMVVLSIPPVSVMFPGAVSGWAKVIPSYYLVDTLHQVAIFGAGWADVWRNLLILVAFDLGIALVGVATLWRKCR